MPMDSYLDWLRLELAEAMRGFTDDGMAQSPLGKWSASQILEHLLLTYQGTNAGLAKCCDKGKPLATRPTLMHRPATLLVVGLGYMPGGRKSPERVVPRGMPPAEVRMAVLPELQKMAANLDDCERRFGARTKIFDHLILGPLTPAQWRKFHWVHGIHHMRQIRERAGKMEVAK